MENKSMHVLIADHQPQMRFALRVALEQYPGDKIIGEATDAQDMMAQTRVTCPDLALIDWELPGMPMAKLIDALRQACAPLRIIILNSREETREQAIAAGADAFVCMCNAPDELSTEIDKGFKGEPVENKDGPSG
jgi:DNA-binding NarL/FixJ family response regulator